MIDAVIPLGPKDAGLAEFCARAIRRNIADLRSIWVVCAKDPEIPGTIFVDERRFPFSLDTVRAALGVSDRAGWYLQQLIKLYMAQAVPDIAPRYLVVDADTLFLRPCSFVEDGRAVLNFGSEFHPPYFAHMARMHPGLQKLTAFSGITHCMLFDRAWVAELFDLVEQQHPGRSFWQSFLAEVDPEQREKSGASEYETYFNFCLSAHASEVVVKKLHWANLTNVAEIDAKRYDYVSLHWYKRAGEIDRAALEQKLFAPTPQVAPTSNAWNFAGDIVSYHFRGITQPIFFGHDLTPADQTHLRGKPRPFILSAIDLLRKMGGQTIVEIGSMRQPMRHSLEEFNPNCCNDGHSTLFWASTGMNFHSIDINPDCARIAGEACAALPNAHVYCGDGIAFLQEFDQQIDLLFLDAWDVVEGCDFAGGHLRAYQAARDKMAPNSIILIDDTDVKFGGKGRLAIPAIIRDGFDLVLVGRQTMLIRVG
jgi:hypothetical protein